MFGSSAAVGLFVPRLASRSRDIATFIIRRLITCSFKFSVVWFNLVISKCQRTQIETRTRTWWYAAVGDEAEMLMHIRHSTPMLDLVAHRIDEHVPY